MFYPPQILHKQTFYHQLLLYSMIQFTEEIKGQRAFHDHLPQNNTTESRYSVINKSILKGRPATIQELSKKHVKKRKTIDLSSQIKEQLPVLGRPFKSHQSTRLYESIIQLKSQQKSFKNTKVLLSELTGTINNVLNVSNLSNHRLSNKSCCNSQKIQTLNQKSQKKKNKVGYQRQKLRLNESKQKMMNLFSNYERVNSNVKIESILTTLKNEVIRKQAKKHKLLECL